MVRTLPLVCSKVLTTLAGCMAVWAQERETAPASMLPQKVRVLFTCKVGREGRKAPNREAAALALRAGDGGVEEAAAAGLLLLSVTAAGAFAAAAPPFFWVDARQVVVGCGVARPSKEGSVLLPVAAATASTCSSFLLPVPCWKTRHGAAKTLLLLPTTEETCVAVGSTDAATVAVGRRSTSPRRRRRRRSGLRRDDDNDTRAWCWYRLRPLGLGLLHPQPPALAPMTEKRPVFVGGRVGVRGWVRGGGDEGRAVYT